MIFYSQNVWNERKGDFSAGYIEIEKGRIKSIAAGKPEGSLARKKIKDYGKLYIGPSAIDLHVHSRGFEESHKETFESLEAAAFKGGVSVGACMANTRPRLDSLQMIDRFLKEAGRCKVKFIPFASVSKNLEGKVATEWNALLKRPIAGLSDDGKPVLDVKMFEGALRATKRAHKIFSLHEEDTRISKGSILYRSETSMRLGVEGTPEDAEASMVERDLAIAKKVKAHLHFAHLSSARSVALIRAAKRRGVSASAELTPHHGLITVEGAEDLSFEKLSRFKVCPVIRSKKDLLALRKGLSDGSVDCFASDHAPHSELEKDLPINRAMHGMISFENYFPLYNEIRLRARLSWRRFYSCFSGRPAALLGLSGTHGAFKAGCEASFIIFDPQIAQVIEWTRSRSKNTPFENFRARGKVIEHWIRGAQVYES